MNGRSLLCLEDSEKFIFLVTVKLDLIKWRELVLYFFRGYFNLPTNGVMVFCLHGQHVMSEPFEPSPFMPSGTRGFDNDLNVATGGQQRGQPDSDVSYPANDKEITRENNVAKIKVVVCWLYSSNTQKFSAVAYRAICTFCLFLNGNYAIPIPQLFACCRYAKDL